MQLRQNGRQNGSCSQPHGHNMNTRKQHQREIECGLKPQLTPELECSEAWRRASMAAHLERRTVIELAADGIMAAVEAAEDALRNQRGLN
jgi:hypothetical protein